MDSRETELNRTGVSGSPSYQTSDDIRRRIETRRAEMDVIADVLQEKLSPQHIAHQVRQELRGRTAKTVSSLGESMRANPFPWMVMGLGLAWLVKESRSKSSSSIAHGGRRLALSSSYEGLDQGYDAGYGSTYGYQEREEGTLERAKEKVEHAAEMTKEKVVHTVDVAKEKVAQTAETAKEKMSAAKDRVADTAHRAEEKMLLARDRVSEKAVALEHKAEVGFWQAMEKSPLAVAVAAVGVGVGLALAVPSTQQEEQLLGPVRERLLERAKASGREAFDKAKLVANSVVEETTAKLTEGEGNGHGLLSSPSSGLSRSGSPGDGQQRLAGSTGSGLVGSSSPRTGGSGLSSSSGSSLSSPGSQAGSSFSTEGRSSSGGNGSPSRSLSAPGPISGSTSHSSSNEVASSSSSSIRSGSGLSSGSGLGGSISSPGIGGGKPGSDPRRGGS